MSEIRALLLTDVVDSTALASEVGDAAMATLWARHDRVARDLLVAHGGREIDKTDGFLLLFASASDAAAYARAYHRAIGALTPPLEARVGLHVGPVILTENRPEDVARGAKPLEVDGLAKPTAARIMALARGGQTLLTAEAAAGLGPTTSRVASHGHWRLKGLAEPIELFEVGDDAAPFVPPADAEKGYRVVHSGGQWLPARAVPHALPAERDEFVGREADLQDLARRVEAGSRLVTVLGMGGTGKTRLVLRFAWTWLGDWPGGAWFCDLSDARGLDGIVAAVARTFGVPLGKEDPVGQLGNAIAERGRCLVILDNFEQVARFADATLGAWLDRASDARFVVTTREVLGLRGETALALAPLERAEAVALFVARAQQANREFRVTEEERPHVEALVRLLDGLPLAIELAAARVRVMPPRTLLQRMSERFRLLASTGGRHTRQATLRGALDWSWDLLSTDERSALAQLSVFAGGFGLEDAEEVVSLGELWPMDAVQALVDKSLVRHLQEGRFDLLVSVQEYAAERLDALGMRAAAESRHGAWFARLGTDAAIEAYHTREPVAAAARYLGELANLTFACRRALSRGEGEVVARLLCALAVVLASQGPADPGVELSGRALELPLSPRDEATVRLVRARLLRVSGGGPEALEDLRRALAAAESAGDRRLEGQVRHGLGTLLSDLGHMEEAQREYERGLALHRETGDRVHEARVMADLGVLFIEQGDLDRARAQYEASLKLSRAIGMLRTEAIVLGNLANVASDQGRMDEALAAYEEAQALSGRLGNRRSQAISLGNLGIVLADLGRTAEAASQYERSARVLREIGDRRALGMVLGNLANVLGSDGRHQEARQTWEEALRLHRLVGAGRGEVLALGGLASSVATEDPARAERLLSEAIDKAAAIGLRLEEGMARSIRGLLRARSGRFDEARGDLDAADGLLRAHGHAIELARVWRRRTEVELLAGDVAAARAALAETERLVATSGVGPGSELVAALEELRGRVPS